MNQHNLLTEALKANSTSILKSKNKTHALLMDTIADKKMRMVMTALIDYDIPLQLLPIVNKNDIQERLVKICDNLRSQTPYNEDAIKEAITIWLRALNGDDSFILSQPSVPQPTVVTSATHSVKTTIPSKRNRKAAPKQRKRVTKKDLLNYDKRLIRRKFDWLYSISVMLFIAICIGVYVLWTNGSIGWALLTALLVVPLFIAVINIHDHISDDETESVYRKFEEDRYAEYAIRQGINYDDVKRKIDKALVKWQEAFLQTYDFEPLYPDDAHKNLGRNVMTKRGGTKLGNNRRVNELAATCDKLYKKAVLQMQDLLDDDELDAVNNDDWDEICELYDKLYFKQIEDE